MASAQTAPSFIHELAEFLSGQPSAAALLAYRPRKQFERRCGELLEKQNEGNLTLEEQQELADFMFADRLVRLMKARLRANPR